MHDAAPLPPFPPNARRVVTRRVGLARAIALAAALVAASSVAGPGHPSAQPGLEVPLRLAAGEAWVRGEWAAPDGGAGVRLVESVPGASFLVPRAEAGRVAQGLVRARLRAEGGKHDFTVLYGFRPGEPAEAFSAYGASVEGGTLLLHRFDEGLVSELGPRAVVPRTPVRPALELVLFLAGPSVAVFLYDAETLELLATLTHAEPVPPGGHVGVRVAAVGGVVEALSVSSPESPPLDGGVRPSGPERKVAIARGDVARVPEALRSFLLEPLPGEDPALSTMLLPGPEAVERLRRAGVAPVREFETYAWVDVDPAYRRAVVTGHAPAEGGVLDAEMVEARLRALQASSPSIARLVSLGTTHGGRNVWALRVTRDPDGPVARPAVLVNGAHHGDELLSSLAVLDGLAQVLERARLPRERALIDGLDLWFVPLVNPDGNMRFMRTSMNAGRKNGRDLDGDGAWQRGEGVDLNRNYPFQWGALGEVGSRSWPRHHRYRGPGEASEPETRAMVELARAQHFVASLSWHTASTAVLPPYTVQSVRPPEPNVARLLAEALVRGGPVQRSGRAYRVLPRLYPVDGTDQDWHAWAHGTAALLVEGPLHNPRTPGAVLDAVRQGRFLLDRFLDAALAGPRLSLVVQDAAGRPLEALVTVEGLETFAGERWTSRPRDGRFELLVDGAAPRTVRVSAPGLKERRVRVTPGKTARVVLE